MTESGSDSPVLVLGGGFAGLAAAWAARRAGARVQVVHAAAGASALYSGIVDGLAVGGELSELCRALGLVIAATPRPIATREGSVRLAAGWDSALLALDRVAGGHVGVVDVGRDDWDAALLAESYAASDWARRTGTRFSAVPVPALASGAERRIASYDLARAFEAPAREQALCRALQSTRTVADGWLFGPWLGVERDLAAALEDKLGKPVGEVSSMPGGAAGARLEHRRGVVLEALGIPVRRARAVAARIASDGAGVELELEDGARLRGCALVLALGGVLAGGIALVHEGALAARAFRLSVAAPVTIELDGEPFDGVSSLSGVSFQRLGMDAIVRVGVRADAHGRTGAASIYAAGDLLAARTRTVLSALASGHAAGQRAAESRVSSMLPLR